MFSSKVQEKLENLGFGQVDDGEFSLNKYEIEYCLEKGYLKNVEAQRLDENEQLIYRVFKELREHGIICRFTIDSDLIRVYQKGFRPGEDRTKYLMKVISNKFPTKKQIEEYIKISKKMRKEFVVAIVDEKITYLKINQTMFF